MSTATEIPMPVAFSPGLQPAEAAVSFWLRQATLRLRREICWIWQERGLLPPTSTTTLPPFSDQAATSLNLTRYSDEKRDFFRANPTALYLTEQIEAAVPPRSETCRRGSLDWVIQRLALDDTATLVLALGLLAAFDSAAGSVVAACLNDPAKTSPTLALAQRLWDHPDQVMALADASHPLFRYGLLQTGSRQGQPRMAVDWESPISVPALVAGHLLRPDSASPSVLASIATSGDPPEDIGDESRFVAARLAYSTGEMLRVVPVTGSRGAAFRETVSRLARLAGRPVVEFTGTAALLLDAGFRDALASFCWLRGCDLFLGPDLADRPRKEEHQSSGLLPRESIPIVVYLGATENGQLDHVPGNVAMPAVHVPRLSYSKRVAQWQAVLGDRAKPLAGAVQECSRRFRYEAATIDRIGQGLRALRGSIPEQTLLAACRVESELDLGELAQKVTPRFSREELILPPRQNAQFEEIAKAMKSLTEVHYGWGTAEAWNEGGISALFAGLPGTGKTMAAEILARKLDLPMYRIDLSQVVNKYIGETEKNLKRLFDAADISDMILFFDEADALFGRRTEVRDAHDRYANLEISYLLERMERFKGLAILATNRKKDLDEAFLRRLRFVLDFPLPEVEERRRIWEQVVPQNVDRSELKMDFLARQFPLAGGSIRSIVFNACLQCADGTASTRQAESRRLTMEQVVIATKREFEKMNRSVSLEQFGPYAETVRRMEARDARHQD